MQNLVISEESTITPIMQEVYRRLRTNIEFTGADNRMICLTSVSSNDGKRVVAYNLAKAFAENGKSTLLIDADMRNSVLDKRLGYSSQTVGLSHYLAGKSGILDSIYNTNIENLCIMPSGIFPKNPAELLGKGRFNELVNVVKKAFRYKGFAKPKILVPRE